MIDTFSPSSPPASSGQAPRLTLRTGAIFGRVFLAVFVTLAVARWLRRIRPRMPFRPRYRRIVAMLWATPMLAVKSVLIAALTAMIVDLVFRAIVRPLMIQYYEPRPRGLSGGYHDLAFRLAPGERIVAEIPARRVEGRRERPGTLVCTTRRLSFCPFAWTAERWEADRASLHETALAVQPQRRVLGLVHGYPAHVCLGPNAQFAVADPDRVLRWLQPETLQTPSLI